MFDADGYPDAGHGYRRLQAQIPVRRTSSDAGRPALRLDPSREGGAGTYDPAKQVIGSGPFILDSYTPDVAVTISAIPNGSRRAVPTSTAFGCRSSRTRTAGRPELRGRNWINRARRQRSGHVQARQSQSRPVHGFCFGAMDPLVDQLGDPSSPWADHPYSSRAFDAFDRYAIGASVLERRSSSRAAAPALGNGELNRRPR